MAGESTETMSPPTTVPTAPDVAASSPARLARVCVVVPAYNEARSVGRVVHELRQHLPRARVVVVDDGSSDATVAEARAAGAAVVSLPVNLGIGGAVQAGYRYALRHGFDLAMQVDGDGQHHPSEAPRLLDAVVSGGADIALGSRWLGRGDYVAPTGRRVGMRILSRMVRWRAGKLFTDTTSGFRALGPRALALFAASYPTDFPEVESLVLATQAGLEVVEVPVEMSERRHGRSSIAGVRSAYYMARVALALAVGGLDRGHRP
ncbi:MAG: glycosyltransferase family 2 protein [Acidimicrobiales bacterium]